MEEAVSRFAQEIQHGYVALFYFSGHGVQVKGENYLIPIGERIESEADIRYKAVNAGQILAKMEESGNRINILILDACRNNPFKSFRSQSKGLTMMDAPKGTFVAYATAPGSVAADGAERNSPYTKHLIQVLKNNDLPIEQAFKHVLRAVEYETGGKQTPWYSSCLRDDFYFKPMVRVSPEPVSPIRERPQAPPVARPRPPSIEVPKPIEEPSYEDYSKGLLSLAEQGNATAQNNLGWCYQGGKGVAKDDAEAVKWYRKAAEQGNAVAQCNLGLMYDHGYGVRIDRSEAVKWFRKAADQGYARAQHLLSYQYEMRWVVPKDDSEALRWYLNSAKQGNVDAQVWLGFSYEHGCGAPKDYSEAVKWYRKAAQVGNAEAQFHLGDMYEHGKGVAQNHVEAVNWYRKSAAQGNGWAKGRLQPQIPMRLPIPR